MTRSYWRSKALYLLLGFLLILPSASTAQTDYSFEVVAQTSPDECWSECGGPYLPYSGGCPEGTREKRNQAYVWSMAKWGNDIWVGTGPNIAVLAQAVGNGLALGGETEDCSYSCAPGVADCGPDNAINVIEGGNSQYPEVPEFLRSFLGDWRPPEVWVYDIDTGIQVNLTPDDALIGETLGLRAAGAANGVVILAGLSRYGLGVNMFAFNASTYEYLGSRTFVLYSDIRRFVYAKDVLYVGVQTTDGGGAILRWNGNLSNPFSFGMVGFVDNNVAYITEHEGRLFAATWRPTSVVASLAGTFFGERAQSAIWMSPTIPKGGLRWYHSLSWTKVWEVTDYEPSEVVAYSHAVGDLVSFGGYLYWGNMVPPFSAQSVITENYGEDAFDAFTPRKIAIFRGKNLAGNAEIDLLYGEETLSQFDQAAGEWVDAPNNMGGAEPLLGPSGFDEKNANVYTWAMAVHLGKLFVGTLELPNPEAKLTTDHQGGDLWVFNNTTDPAEPVTRDGFGNPLTVDGVRNLISTKAALFAGTSSRANLHPEGGWKLIQIE